MGKKIIKNLLILLAFSLINVFPSINVFAEDAKPSRPFSVEVNIQTQSPWTKKIPVEIKITPNLDSKRTEISWTTPSIIEIDPQYDNYFFAEKGRTYTVKAYIVPVGYGSVSGSVDVIDWDYGYNYGTSEPFAFTLNQNREIIPYSDSYKRSIQQKNIAIIVGMLMFFVLLVFLIIFLAKKIIAYLKIPEDLKS